MAASPTTVVIKNLGDLRARIAHLERNPELSADLNHWDISGLAGMNCVFMNTKRQYIVSAWDMSNVVEAESMFRNSAFNGDISNWNTSRLNSMSGMFAKSAFNGDISRWDVSQVEDMGALFASSAFQGDISNWNTKSLKCASCMFANTKHVADLSRWDTSKIEVCSDMFEKSVAPEWFALWTLPNAAAMWNMMDEKQKKRMKTMTVYHWFQALAFNEALPEKEAAHLALFKPTLVALEFSHPQAANYLHQEWLYAQGLRVKPDAGIPALAFDDFAAA